uniref:Spindle pole body component n=1 Tax=Kalmanozyma brasiliensis (strain GHG001) TaxID=1365824 RepID=V5EJL5_KALBG
MTPVAGSSSSGLLPGAVRSGSTRTASRSKTNKRIDQERIVDHLLAVFLDSQDAPSTPSSSSRASQKAKAINFVEKDSWSPADDDEIAAALQGLSLKHSIHLDYELATALKRCYSQLLVSCERSVRLTDQARESEKRRGSANARNLPDPLVRPDNVADAVRFLLQLSKPADVTARTTANLMLNATQSNRAQYLTPEQRRQAEKREWLGILVDEPLEGDVWADDDVDQDTSDLSDWSLDSDDEKRLRIGEGYDSDKEIRLSFAVNRADDLLFKDRLVQHMIKHDASLSTSDSTFWTSGYNAKHSRGHATLDDVVDQGYSPPAFLQSIVQDVVTTAKGVGLLRSLGIDALGEVQPDGDLDRILGLRSLVPASVLQQGRGRHQEGDVEHALTGGNASVKHAAATPEAAKATLRRLLFPKSAQGAESKPLEETLPQTPLSQPDSEPSWQLGSANRRSRTSNRLLEPMLGQALQEHLSPISAIVRKRLFEVLSSPVTDGGYALQTHLRACHGLFLMQEGAEMTSWFDSLFRDLDRPNGTIRAVHQHRLNSTFIDVLEAHEPGRAGQVWIDANLVRFFTGDDDADSAAAIRQRTRIRRLADVQVEYEVPWPLTFAFPTACMRFYQTMFTTLLQARYAQWKLSATLKLAKPETMHMRKFWALRRQAQWLVRTLIAFLQSDVLLDGSERLCAALEGATSLDSAIQIHTEALERMEKLCFHRIEQVKVKELFGAAWRIGAEVVNNYERFIGTSSQGEDRLARRKRRERRKKQRDRAKREGAPLGAIVEEDEEEEEEDAEDDQNEADYGELLRDYDGPAQPGAYDVYSDDVTLARSDAFGSTSVDASMSVDTSASWLDSETNKRERFRVECERQRKALLRLVEELKVNVDDQIGRIAARAAAQAQDATLADRALQEHDYARAKWQGLLDALAWSDLSY